MTLLSALGDVKAQLAGLVFPGFLARTGLSRLAHLPRYLEGALLRVRTLSDAPGRDRQRMTEFERAAAAFTEAGGAIPAPADAAPSSTTSPPSSPITSRPGWASRWGNARAR